MAVIEPPVGGPTTGIEVNPSSASAQAASVTRDALLVMSALPALIAVLGTHDVSQIVDFLSGTQFAPALGVIVTVGVMGWRQLLARKRKNLLTKIARDPQVPDHVIRLKNAPQE